MFVVTKRHTPLRYIAPLSPQTPSCLPPCGRQGLRVKPDYQKHKTMNPKNGKTRKKRQDITNRDEIIRLRVTAFEKYALQSKAESTGLSVSEYLRKCGLGRELPVLPSSEEVQAYIELKNLETNFKRISNLYAQTKNPYYQDFVSEIKSVILEVQQRLNTLKNGQ